MTGISEPANQPDNDLSTGTAEERLALVERVGGSAAFSRSVRLRDFLRYVGQRAAKSEAAEVHEQEIGEKVFGRPAGYDRSQDNIVRVNASELRRRIDAYFATEGATEPIEFSIPRGGYMPVFRSRATEAAPVQLEGSANVPLAPEQRIVEGKDRNSSWGLWVLVAVIGVACGVLLWQNARLRGEAAEPDRRPTVADFWASVTKNAENTDVVLPDDSITVEEEMTGKRIPLRDYADRNFSGYLDLNSLGRDRSGDLKIVLMHNLVTLGAFYAALRIHDVHPRSTSMRVTSARFYSADSMKRDNVVLIGGAKANPWVDLYEDQLNFHFDYSAPDHSLTIQNRHPQAGEANSYRDDDSFGYSSVVYLPNPSNNGSVILLMGSDSDGSNAAAEYLTSEDSLKILLQTLHRKTFPHFEVLLRVSRLRGTALGAKIVAYRVY